MATILEVAAAVASELNAGSFGMPLTAERGCAVPQLAGVVVYAPRFRAWSGGPGFAGWEPVLPWPGGCAALWASKRR